MSRGKVDKCEYIFKALEFHVKSLDVFSFLHFTRVVLGHWEWSALARNERLMKLFFFHFSSLTFLLAVWSAEHSLRLQSYYPDRGTRKLRGSQIKFFFCINNAT